MTMKAVRMQCLVAVFCMLPLMTFAEASPTKADIALKQQAQEKAKAFAVELKQALLGAVKNQGFEQAVYVCQSVAPEIAAKLSVDGWHLSRTSLRARNPSNTADEWEIQQLEFFDQAFKAGAPVSTLTAQLKTPNRYRYMQAIPTGEVCLACHGGRIEPSLEKAIQAAYPRDMATGFTREDIRGAFSLSKSF